MATNEYLQHAAARYRATYGSTPLTEAFLAPPNLHALAASFQRRLTALYSEHGLQPPLLVVDESWVLELFEHLHRTRDLHQSVGELNTSFEYRFFKSLNTVVREQARYHAALADKADVPVRYRRAYSAANIPQQLLTEKAHHQELPLTNVRHHSALPQRTFAPNRSVHALARGIH